jgi:uncharacterized membrane protein
MRGPNAGIGTPFFAFVFFGPLPLAPATAGAVWVAGERASAGVAIAAAALNALGVLLVTFMVNVPLKEALAALPVTASNAAASWQEYARPWSVWNHLRVAASTATLLLLMLATLLRRR